ncbi:hypothetical protein BCV70DRAFT_212469 [Testicularia cyperi]|uniref:Uncharacterized protein n=1 Tax=Testicularia cyperi TaxID=1882483 RepID=A0A317XP86_9BASI|nr:hypothetical protein BCV70DRAFT_212469 [Testicularia cyperi]
MPSVSSGRIPTPTPVNAPLPAAVLHCTVFASYDINSMHPTPFCHVGCPATHARGESSATSRRQLAQQVTKFRKRLGVQIPLPYLGSSDLQNSELYAYLPHPHPRNGAEMMARSGNLRSHRRISLFQAQAKELTGIVSRPLVERVISAVYANQGVYNRMAIFPAQAVLSYGAEPKRRLRRASSSASNSKLKPKRWLDKLRSSSSSSSSKAGVDDADSKSADVHDNDPGEPGESCDLSDSDKPSYVKVPMMFATLDLLAPPPRFLESGGPYPKEMNKVSSAESDRALKALAEFDRMSDEERYSIYGWVQDDSGRQLLVETLRALERRGGIWTEAGRLTTPSSRNPESRKRCRFLVKGLFPERFANRCKYYRKREFQPMPSDLDSGEIERFGYPIIVHTASERTGNQHVDIHAFVGDAAESSSSGTAPLGQLDPEPASPAWEWDENEFRHQPSRAQSQSQTPTNADDTVGGQQEHHEPLPTYTAAQLDQLSGFGIDSSHALQTIDVEGDFFQGWSIGVTEEPYKNGGWMESLGSGSRAWYVGAAGGGW